MFAICLYRRQTSLEDHLNVSVVGEDEVGPDASPASRHLLSLTLLLRASGPVIQVESGPITGEQQAGVASSRGCCDRDGSDAAAATAGCGDTFHRYLGSTC